MKAVILCGGEGTRMRPLTYETPKPLLKIGDKTILEYVFGNLKKNGITEVILTVGYLKEKIIEYFGNGEKFGMHIEYVQEEEAQNTAGSIIPLKNKLDEDFIVMMGDQLTDINFNKMNNFHKEKGGIATIALVKKEFKIEYGVVEVENEQVTGFKEKPVLEKYANTAIYILSPKIFDFIVEKDDFAKNVFPKMLEQNEKINTYIMSENWVDIGRIRDYEDICNNQERISFTKEFF